MANSPNNSNRLYDGSNQFLLGVNSNLHPSQLNAQSLSWMVNATNKRGFLRTRPGYKSLFRLPDGRAQGFTLFTPTDGEPTMVMAVNGKIYISVLPFETFSILPNVNFDPFVDQIAFKETVQALENGQPRTPRSLLFMQDGKSQPAFWDGQTARHTTPGVQAGSETVVGLWMEFVGGRLWVARGRELFASDLFDPLHFIENQYIAGGGSLQAVDGDTITCLRRTADNKNLLVFTIHNTTIVQASITDRNLWSTTPGFISLLFPGVGCAGGKAITDNNGELWWFSVEGARRFAQVGQAISTSRNNIASIEMRRSFENLSPTLSRSCAFSFGSFLGFSVPSGDLFNRHTWVLDTSTASQLTADSPFAWQGIWMGTRPVEWATGFIDGFERVFYLSQDRCGIRMWEAFQKDQLDNGSRIFVSIEFPGLQFNESLSFKRFMFTEYHLTEVFGKVDLTSEYRGDWGCWKNIMSLFLCAKDCEPNLPCIGNLQTLMPQNRYIKTQEALHSCQTQEGTYSEDIGTFFQNRLRWYGKNGVRMYRSQSHQFQENSTGACAKSDTVCKPLLCCDEEVDYISFVRDGYGYGSSPSQVPCSI